MDYSIIASSNSSFFQLKKKRDSFAVIQNFNTTSPIPSLYGVLENLLASEFPVTPDAHVPVGTSTNFSEVLSKI